MKRLLLLAALLSAGVATHAVAASKVRIVAPWRAGQYQGAVMAVRGIADIRQDTNLQGTEVRLLNADGHVQFFGFVSKLNQSTFPNLLALQGREVVMYGVIEMYRATPATQLLYRDQIQAWPIARRG